MRMKYITKNDWKEEIVGYAPGVWDMLHRGHINFIEEAKEKYCEKLIIGIQDDELVKKQKGNYPIIPLIDRLKVLESLKYVDEVVIYEDYNYANHMKLCNADLFITSDIYRNTDKFKDVRNVVYLPYTNFVSSTQIKKNAWGEIWDKVGKSNISDIEVNSDNIDYIKIEKLTKYIIDKLDIDIHERLLDYGCGSGLVLQFLQKECIDIWGIDISENMIKRAKENVHYGMFLVSDNIPIRIQFDHIISCGVFHYFPDWEYTQQIIKQMQMLGNKILLIDLPDIDKKNKREQARRNLGKELFPLHLYFQKQDFIDLGFEVWNNDTDYYNYSEYGFNAIWKK